MLKTKNVGRSPENFTERRVFKPAFTNGLAIIIADSLPEKMNYTQKLYVIDEDKYRRMKAAQPLPNSDEVAKTFASQFIQNKVESVVDEDNSWSRMGSRVQPILEASFNHKGGPLTAASNQSVGLASPAGASNQIPLPEKGKGQSGIQTEAEIAIRSTLDKKIVGKGIRLLKYLQNLPGVDVKGGKFVVDGVPTRDLLVEILEDLLRKRNTLSVSIDPLLSAVAKDGANVSSMIFNQAAKKLISKFKEGGGRQEVGAGESDDVDLAQESGHSPAAPSASPRKELSFTPQKSPSKKPETLVTPFSTPKQVNPKSSDVREKDRIAVENGSISASARKYPKTQRTPPFSGKAPLVRRTPPTRRPGAQDGKEEEKKSGYKSYFFPN